MVLNAALALAAGSAMTGQATAQQSPPPPSPPSPEMTRADSLFRAGDWTNAAAAYTAIASRDSMNGLAWFRTGVARHALKEHAAADVAYRRSIALKFNMPQATIRLARINAADGRTDAALQLLEGLANNGFPNMNAITSQPELAALKDNARYKTIIASMEAKRFPCRALAESRQLDYWAGSWDVMIGGQKVGTNEVVPMLAGCALQENWTDAQGGEGKSMNYFDPNTRKWRQVWVSDNGGVLDYTGEFKDGAMRFSGVTIGPNGQRTLQKLTFFPISQDSVRQLFETSTDEGKTWTAGFDGLYVRRKAK
jgi:hypothetical protein